MQKSESVKSELYNKEDLIAKALQMNKAELEVRYNNLDIDFIKENPHLVIVQRSENIMFYEYKYGHYTEITLKDMEFKVDEFLEKGMMLNYRTVGKIKDAIARITAKLARTQGKIFRDSDIDRQKYYINMRNGLLDPQTKQLVPHTPSYFSTFQTPFDYDPAAEISKFQDFLDKVSNYDRDTERMIQDMFGYVLCVGGNPKHKIFFLYGETARNGKSTTAKILAGILGKENTSSISLEGLSKQGHEMISLVNSQLNISDETSAKFIESSALISMAAEGDIQINPKYKRDFSYTVKTKFIIPCNDIPRFNNSQGMYHRMIAIPFTYQFPQKDRVDRYDEIIVNAEGSAIVNWAIKGYEKLQERGEFFINEKALEDAHDLRMQGNSVFAFLESCYDFSDTYEEGFSNKDLYGDKRTHDTLATEYNHYCFV